MTNHQPLNLRQLQHVVWLAEEQHFGRAAERACLSQPAFSRSVAAFEQSIGIRLFERGPSFVRLTSTGSQVMARARRLLSSSSDLVREVDLLRSGDLGDITVGSGPFSGPTLMATAIAKLQTQHPSVHVRLEIGSASVLREKLLEETLDFFMADQTELTEHPRCHIEVLGESLGCLYVRSSHPLAKQKNVSLAQVNRFPLASVHLPAPLGRALAGILSRDDNGLVLVAMECESVLVLREYALKYDAVILAPQNAFSWEESAGVLCRLDVAELKKLGDRTPLRMKLGLTWLTDRTPSAAARLLAECVYEAAKETLLHS